MFCFDLDHVLPPARFLAPAVFVAGLLPFTLVLITTTTITSQKTHVPQITKLLIKKHSSLNSLARPITPSTYIHVIHHVKTLFSSSTAQDLELHAPSLDWEQNQWPPAAAITITPSVAVLRQQWPWPQALLLQALHSLPVTSPLLVLLPLVRPSKHPVVTGL